MFERTRTYNLLIRSQTLYPIELQTLKGKFFLVLVDTTLG